MVGGEVVRGAVQIQSVPSLYAGNSKILTYRLTQRTQCMTMPMAYLGGLVHRHLVLEQDLRADLSRDVMLQIRHLGDADLPVGWGAMDGGGGMDGGGWDGVDGL